MTEKNGKNKKKERVLEAVYLIKKLLIDWSQNSITLIKEISKTKN